MLSVADTVVDAVKSGAIKHFFLVAGCDGARPGRNYYTDFVKATPDDTVVLTLACGKFRFNDLDLGTVAGLPRLMDMGQCNDAYGAIRVAVALAEAFECGMGEQATAWLAEAAGKGAATVFAPTAGKRGQATVRIAGVDGAANVAAIDVVAPAGAAFDLTVSLDSPAAGNGVVGVVLRVFAGENAHVNVTSVHTLDDTWMALDDTGIICDEGAFVTVRHRMLGAGKSYTGLATDLRGDLSRVDVDTRYLAAGQDVRDFNYIVRHRGKKTRCNIDANGALMGESKKVLRGTIDLVRGCKGAEGTERETVLLVDERADNKTIPVILCDEDDVAGNHGATIGHVAADQLFYLKCRGLSQEAAEGLFATATLEETALAVEDETVRAGVGRLAGRLGIPYQEVED